MEEYDSWIRTLWIDHGFAVIFDVVTIMLTSILTYGVLRPQYLASIASPPAQWEIVVVQGEWFATAWGEAGRILMLVNGFFLFDVLLSVDDFSAGVWASNVDTNSELLLPSSLRSRRGASCFHDRAYTHIGEWRGSRLHRRDFDLSPV